MNSDDFEEGVEPLVGVDAGLLVLEHLVGLVVGDLVDFEVLLGDLLGRALAELHLAGLPVAGGGGLALLEVEPVLLVEGLVLGVVVARLGVGLGLGGVLVEVAEVEGVLLDGLAGLAVLERAECLLELGGLEGGPGVEARDEVGLLERERARRLVA